MKQSMRENVIASEVAIHPMPEITEEKDGSWESIIKSLERLIENQETDYMAMPNLDSLKFRGSDANPDEELKNYLEARIAAVRSRLRDE